jgi:capsular polysaccharide transport system ATP-binding protein
MIFLDGVTAGSDAKNLGVPVLRAVDLIIPSDRRIALVGATRDETRTLFNLLSGAKYPAEGQIVRKVSVSFPVGYAGGFLKNLSVRTNVAHLARIYGADIKTTVEFVARSSRLQQAFDKPYGDLPKKLQRRLAAIVAYTIPFDVYLLTQNDVRGKLNRGNVALHLFTQRHVSAGMIISTGDSDFAAKYCDMAMVLNEQKLSLYESINEAFQVANVGKSGARRRKPNHSEELTTDGAPEDEQQSSRVEMKELPKLDTEAGKLSREERQAWRAARQEQARQGRGIRPRLSEEERQARRAARKEERQRLRKGRIAS